VNDYRYVKVQREIQEQKKLKQKKNGKQSEKDIKKITAKNHDKIKVQEQKNLKYK
jgi:hypothetical protein